MSRVLLPVRSFRQKTDECAVAAAAAVAHYYDRSVKYEQVSRMLKRAEKKDGLFSSQQARLLNWLGFTRVRLVTSDIELFDFSWQGLPKHKIIAKLKHVLRLNRARAKRNVHGDRKIRQECKHDIAYVADIIDWLAMEDFENDVIIDNDFSRYIRRSIDRGHPLCMSFCSTSLFKLKKGPQDKNSDIHGSWHGHSVVVRGYDDKGVFVVDSDYRSIRGARCRYKIKWHRLLPSMLYGNLVLVD